MEEKRWSGHRTFDRGRDKKHQKPLSLNCDNPVTT
jgi:hypothetical protein